MEPLEEDTPLDAPHAPRPDADPLTEWSGLFLFAVGAYGTFHRPLTRHLTLWGVVPLDAFYALLMIGGAVLMLWGSPWSPFHPAQAAKSPAGHVLLAVRRAFSLLVLAALFWLAVLR
jgi:hypothetical protein